MRSLIRVERIALRGPGVLLLTGGTASERGALADELGELLAIEPARRLRVAELLAETGRRAQHDALLADLLDERLSLSATTSIFDCLDTTPALTEDVRSALPDLEKCLGRAPSRFISEQVGGCARVSSLDWLRYCAARRRDVPHRWLAGLLTMELESRLAGSVAPDDRPWLLEGAPLTAEAVPPVLAVLERLGLEVLCAVVLGDPIARPPERGLRRAGPCDALAARLGETLGAHRVVVGPGPGAEAAPLAAPLAALVGVREAGGTCRIAFDQQWVDQPLAEVLRALGVPAVIVRDLLEARRSSLGARTAGADG